MLHGKLPSVFLGALMVSAFLLSQGCAILSTYQEREISVGFRKPSRYYLGKNADVFVQIFSDDALDRSYFESAFSGKLGPEYRAVFAGPESSIGDTVGPKLIVNPLSIVVSEENVEDYSGLKELEAQLASLESDQVALESEGRLRAQKQTALRGTQEYIQGYVPGVGDMSGYVDGYTAWLYNRMMASSVLNSNYSYMTDEAFLEKMLRGREDVADMEEEVGAFIPDTYIRRTVRAECRVVGYSAEGERLASLVYSRAQEARASEVSRIIHTERVVGELADKVASDYSFDWQSYSLDVVTWDAVSRRIADGSSSSVNDLISAERPDGNQAPYYLLLGVVHHRENEYLAAREAYEEALKLAASIEDENLLKKDVSGKIRAAMNVLESELRFNAMAP